MKWIKQIDDTGCGIACVAMLTGRHYNEVKSVLIEQVFAEPEVVFYTRHHHIKKLIHLFGCESVSRRFLRWRDIRGHAIVPINRSGNNFHWVVFVNARQPYVLDPNNYERRYEFRGLRSSGEYILFSNSTP